GAPGGLVGVPRGLGSLSFHRFHVQDRPEDPGPSGFTPPEAVHAKFASPRRPGGVLPACDWLALRGSQVPDTSPATRDAARSSRCFGRPRTLPPTGQGEYGTSWRE